jgi:hypothetical protein
MHFPFCELIKKFPFEIIIGKHLFVGLTVVYHLCILLKFDPNTIFFKSSNRNKLERSDETPFGIVGNFKCSKNEITKQENKKPHPG